MTNQHLSTKRGVFTYDDKLIQEMLDTITDDERYDFFKMSYSIGWDACILMLKTNEGIDLERLKTRLYDDAFIKSELDFGSKEFNFKYSCYSKGWDDCADFLVEEFGISAMQGANWFIGDCCTMTWRQMLDFIGINYTSATLKGQ